LPRIPAAFSAQLVRESPCQAPGPSSLGTLSGDAILQDAVFVIAFEMGILHLFAEIGHTIFHTRAKTRPTARRSMPYAQHARRKQARRLVLKAICSDFLKLRHIFALVHKLLDAAGRNTAFADLFDVKLLYISIVLYATKTI
jgi:hypothetical protein